MPSNLSRAQEFVGVSASLEGAKKDESEGSLILFTYFQTYSKPYLK